MKKTSILLVAIATLIVSIVIASASATHTMLPGNMNGDGKVNSADARAVLRIAARLEPMPEPVEVVGEAPVVTTAAPTTEAPTEPPVQIAFDASKYNSDTLLSDIWEAFPNGTMSDDEVHLDDGNYVIFYQYKNMTFAFIDNYLQTVFISYGSYEPYTDQDYDDMMDPLELNSKDNFLPSFGLSGGEVEFDEDGYLLMHDCGCDTLIMTYDGTALLGVQIAYTDAFVMYN